MATVATTLGGWVLAIARALESYGIDPEPVCRVADIDLDAAWDPNARFEVVKTTRLFQLGAEVSEDPCFGLTVGRMMRPTSWHALGFSLWASQDLTQALERVNRFTKIFTNSAYTGLDFEPDRLKFWGRSYPAYQPVLTNYQYEAFLSTVMLTCRHLYPHHFQPLRVGLPRREALDDMSSFERMFKCPILLDQDRVWMEIDLETAAQRLPTANPELAQKNDQICLEYISRFDRSDVQSQVYYRLLEDLSEGEPQMDTMAERLNVSVRTLQRKLREQGTSYKQLVDDVRKDLAMQYMEQSHMPIAEVSYRLGFAHVGNFSRAFKRWSGDSPAEWRERRETPD
ncbi:AraC family transcriptional regulator [Motiliproteus coralliicola]|uniref:AraC family transcriptional regulator n=1 Tax=Motiliproteus coralliicola TaxID=2283196 RepID=A0A369WVS6_9GAMM|nr:AraC family transcriptional regulator [Motiliproteus coralliicola]RDE24654.1 AraC family transcriptional regulator [Motiliproteus coralliicola]